MEQDRQKPSVIPSSVQPISKGQRISHKCSFVKKIGQGLNYHWQAATKSKSGPFEPFEVATFDEKKRWKAYADPERCLVFKLLESLPHSKLVGLVSFAFHVPPEISTVKPPKEEDEYDAVTVPLGRVCLQLRRAVNEFVILTKENDQSPLSVVSRSNVDYELSDCHFSIIEMIDSAKGVNSSVVALQCKAFSRDKMFVSMADNGSVTIKRCTELENSLLPKEKSLLFKMEGYGYHSFKSLKANKYLGFCCKEKIPIAVSSTDFNKHINNASFFIRPVF